MDCELAVSLFLPPPTRLPVCGGPATRVSACLLRKMGVIAHTVGAIIRASTPAARAGKRKRAPGALTRRRGARRAPTRTTTATMLRTTMIGTIQLDHVG